LALIWALAGADASVGAAAIAEAMPISFNELVFMI
jgi:hypothetical protein